MRYVSTRGEAPPLGFIDVTLAGLARDGGLYVPETLAAAFAGGDRRLRRPALCRGGGRGDPAVRRRHASPKPTCRGWRARPTARSGIRRWCRSSQFGASTFLLELFHGPTLAFKDVAMQLLARLMDHALAARGERTTIVVATSGDTGGAAVEAFRGRERTDLFVLFPDGRISEVQRRMMTTAADDNVHAHRDRGHVRRLPGAGEGPVQPPRLPRPRAAVRRQLDQLGAHRRAGGLLLHRRRDARRAAPQGRLHGADRQFRRHFRRLCRRAHGPADRPAGDRHQRQRHPGAHARDRRLRGARGGGDLVALDGHPGVVEFRAAAVRGRWPRRRAGARADGASLAQSRPLLAVDAARSSEIRALFTADRADEEETAATIRTTLRETRAWSIRTPRSASRSPRRKRAIRRCR